MKSLISALVLSAAAVLPVQADIHDFNPENRTSSAPRLTPGNGRCYTTPDKSKVCYLQLPNRLYSLAIHDVDKPGYSTSVFINCNNGIWKSYGVLNRETLNQYMNQFCKTV